MSQKCDRCGATLKKSAKFCTVCGTSVGRGKTTSSSQSKKNLLKCRNCGRVLKEGTKFCTKCGSTVGQAPFQAVSSTNTHACPHCSFSKNPESSNFCINCGRSLTSADSTSQQITTEQSSPVAVPSAERCESCGKEVKPGSKFCIYCGSKLNVATNSVESSKDVQQPSTTTAPSVSSIKPLATPAKVLASLMARGRQLALEEEYAKKGVDSDELFEELSQVADNSDFELEALIDTYINEHSELERLEVLYEKGEVSERVYNRLGQEYEGKLDQMDEQIKNGLIQLQGYQGQIQHDYTQTKEELETLNARLLIGDEETKDVGKKKKLSEKIDRLKYALIACDHILKKESVMRNGPITRFEVTETTLADSKVNSSEPEENEVVKDEEQSEEPEVASSTSLPPPSDTEAGKICPQCGRVTTSEAKFCIHCAAPL